LLRHCIKRKDHAQIYEPIRIYYCYSVDCIRDNQYSIRKVEEAANNLLEEAW